MNERVIIAVALLIAMIGVGGYALARQRVRRGRDRDPFNPFR